MSAGHTLSGRPMSTRKAHGYGVFPVRSLDFRKPLGQKACPRGEVPEWSNGAVSKTVERASVPRVRIPLSPPLSCSEPEMRLLLGAFFFLSQRRLAEAAEPRRLAPGPISVSELASVSNRANLVRPGSVSRMPMFSASSALCVSAPFAAVLAVGVGVQRTRSRRFPVKREAISRNHE